MRIVAGKYKGRSLVAPMGYDVRPTTTRIKETLFNVLQGYVEDCVALDLFAGSGALGIECISRGAKEVIFVDKSPASVACVRENLKGISGNCKIFTSDAEAYLARAAAEGKKFDLIFLDPPYKSQLAGRALDVIFSEDLLSEEGFIVYEHSSETPYDEEIPGYVCRTKRMGTVTAEFIRKRTVALMTGSFDPMTVGHEEMLRRAAGQYDEMIVALLVNPDKKYAFTADERLSFANAVCAQYNNARAIYSERMAYEVAEEVGATVIVRGIRDGADEAYEREMAEFNMAHGVKTKYLVFDEHKDVASSKVREELAQGDFSHVPHAARPLVKEAMRNRPLTL